MSPTPCAGQRGSTLAETVVALGIFGIAMLGLNSMLIQTMRTSDFAKDLSTARFLASQRLEQIKSARYQDGDRDGVRDTANVCTDIDEIQAAVFPDEDYGQVDLRNGSRFTFESCAATPDIKATGVMHARANYASGDQGELDFYLNHLRYDNFRREVYIVDSIDFTGAVTNVTLGPPNATARDNVLVTEVTPSATAPKSNYIKYVIVRVKWRGNDGAVHHVTLSTEKAFYIPSF